MRHESSPRSPDPGRRPIPLTALSLLFAFGCLASLLSVVSLLSPGGPLDPMFRANPRAHDAFTGMGAWAFALLLPVSVACAIASVGLWRYTTWGYLTATSMLAINMVADAANAALGIEPRA